MADCYESTIYYLSTIFRSCLSAQAGTTIRTKIIKKCIIKTVKMGAEIHIQNLEHQIKTEGRKGKPLREHKMEQKSLCW